VIAEVGILDTIVAQSLAEGQWELIGAPPTRSVVASGEVVQGTVARENREGRPDCAVMMLLKAKMWQAGGRCSRAPWH